MKRIRDASRMVIDDVSPSRTLNMTTTYEPGKPYHHQLGLIRVHPHTWRQEPLPARELISSAKLTRPWRVSCGNGPVGQDAE